MKLKTWRLVSSIDTGTQTLTVLIDSSVYTIKEDHPNFNKIFEEVKKTSPDVEYIASLIDIGETISNVFSTVTDRVSINNGNVYFDGDKLLDNTLTKVILDKYLNKNVESDSLKGYVNFLENLYTGASETAKESLFDWITAQQKYDGETIEILDDGCFTAYKVVDIDTNGDFYSIHKGYGIVNSVQVDYGSLRNNPGDVVEMPRSRVEEDRDVACSTGLHCGTLHYAKNGMGCGGNRAYVKVKVNPRDVVSVPTDYDCEKIRTRKYIVLGEVH